MIDMGIPLNHDFVLQGGKEIRIKIGFCGRYTVERKVREKLPQPSALIWRTR